MTLILPPTSVIRVSRGDFDPARFAEVDRMTRDTGTYLIPAINRLDAGNKEAPRSRGKLGTG